MGLGRRYSYDLVVVIAVRDPDERLPFARREFRRNVPVQCRGISPGETMIRILAACAALAVCVPSAVFAETFATDDERAVAAADAAFYQATLKEQGAGWGEFADADASLPYAKGKAAIAAYYAKVYAQPGFSLSWHPEYAHVVGDVGVTSGPYEVHVLDKTGHDKKGTGKYVTVWRRQKDGSWRFAWDGGTEDR